MAQGDAQTNVRLPADLKDWLKTSAGEARRSVTAELILILERARDAQPIQPKGAQQ